MTKTVIFRVFVSKTPIQAKGSGPKVQNVFPPLLREGVFDHLFGYFRLILAKMGYFRDLLKPGFLPKS